MAVTGILSRQLLIVEQPGGTEDTAAVNALLATFDSAEQEASVAAETMISTLRTRQNTPSTQAARALLKNLKAVDSAIRVLRDALQSDPRDFGIVRQLRGEYHRKADLIRQTARLLDQLDRALPDTVT